MTRSHITLSPKSNLAQIPRLPSWSSEPIAPPKVMDGYLSSKNEANVLNREQSQVFGVFCINNQKIIGVTGVQIGPSLVMTRLLYRKV